MKRFTETLKWDDQWFRGLPGAHKLVFLYIIDRCNNAGFWEYDEDAIIWHTKLDPKHVQGALKALERGLKGASGWVWVRRFLRHQKNEDLNENNPAHRQIIGLVREQIPRFKDVPEFQEFLQSQPAFAEGASKGLPSPIGIGKGKGEGNGQGKEEGMQGEKPKRTKSVTLEQSEEFLKSKLPPEFHTPEFSAAWKAFHTMRTEIKEPLTDNAMNLIPPKLQKMGAASAVEALNTSALSRWSGIFEGRKNLSTPQARKEEKLNGEYRNPTRPFVFDPAKDEQLRRTGTAG